MIHILIVDDEKIEREGLKYLLSREEGERKVFEASNGKQALQIIRTEDIQLILTDIKMPYMDGLAMSRKLKEQYPNIKIIIFSGFDEFEYAQEHLRLTSFCYGLLRPLDVIRSYRLEGDVVLPEPGNQTMFSYWQSRLTDVFIEDIKKAGGILCNLASDEIKSLFDWKRVEKEVHVITPEFQVWKNGKLASIVIYIKMSRGEMTRFILKNRIENPEDLKSFSWEGFEFNESLSNEKKFVFTNGKEI